MNTTIFALSSGQGRAGVAVIRVSGPNADTILLDFAGHLPKARQATLMTIKEPTTKERLDQCLVLRFLENASFTGEPCFEFHVHGGRAVIQSVLSALSKQHDARLAEAGEFTKRALENGKLDLTQVESLADLIDADTEMQRRQALRGLEGILGVEIKRWRDNIIEMKALIAAEIDFSDEGDVGTSPAADIDSHLERLERQFQKVLASSAHGRIISEGFKIAIIGKPNVGKSTLLNALAASDVAIVTEHAGTTRDVLEVRLDIEGYPVVLLDTAGLRDTQDPVERIGIARARQAASNADLILYLSDQEAFDSNLAQLDLIPSSDAASIRIRTKQDDAIFQSQGNALLISAKTGFGLEELKQAIVSEIRTIASSTEPPVITRERQRLAVEKALYFCQRARGIASHGIEFIDEDIRQMDLALANLLGLVGVEEVLGAIFSRFCVGK